MMHERVCLSLALASITFLKVSWIRFRKQANVDDLNPRVRMNASDASSESTEIWINQSDKPIKIYIMDICD